MTTLHAIWTVDDKTVLINYLNKHQAKAGDGLSFKMSKWNGVAVKVVESTMKGGPKDRTGCKNKWACVCIHCFILTINPFQWFPTQLKKLYEIVDDLKQQLGFKWDEHNGADIGPESQAVWDAYIIVNSQMRHLLHHTNSYEEKTKSGSILE